MQNETPTPGPLEGLPVWVNDANNAWPTLRIAQSVPLGRLEWLWTSRGASIRDSSTSARALFDVSSTHSEPIPRLQNLAHEWYRNPYVYILVTTVKELDDSKDIVAWERVRQFLDSCREELHEYLIIVAASETEVIHERRIIDKLRTEVNHVARGRERVVLVPPASIKEEMRPITHLHHSPSHQDLLVRLRECMRDGVEARVRAYEDEVSRTYLNKNSSSWSFPKFFALKDGMAFVFVQLSRRDLAVKLYDEFQIIMTDSKSLTTRKFCGISATEAARGIANPDERNYRSLLVSESATELDMRTYLFARQVSLLLVDRKFADVAERGLKFITAIARRCAEETLKGDQGISAAFRDTWVFTTARALAAALAPAIPSQAEASHALSAQLSTPRERHTARLVAGFHVHALKAFLGLAHLVLPGCLSTDNAPLVDNREAMTAEAKSTTDEKLKNALSDRKKAELLHSEIANAAASLYEMGGRARGAAALDGDAGMVCLRNNSYKEAESLLAAQCSRFTNDNGWDDLQRRPRLELAKAEKELDRVQEYLVSCLAMLYMTRASRLLGSLSTTITGEDDRASTNATFWIKETVRTAAKLPRVMKYKADRLLDVSVQPNVASWIEGDPASATVEIRSDLPIPVSVDRVMMECKCIDAGGKRKPAIHNRSQDKELSPSPEGDGLVNSPKDTMTFTAPYGPDSFILLAKGDIRINPGVSTIRVFSDEVPRHGLFKVTSVALFLGNLKLVQAAGKVPMHPVVTLKDDETGKVPPNTSSSTMLADLTDCEVRFPIFVASRRKPSATLSIESTQHLYLAPQSVQYVQVCMQAGDNGIVKGSRLKCALLNINGAQEESNETFVQFADSDRAFAGNENDVLSVSPSRGNHHSFDRGEALLDRELGPHELIKANVALYVSSEKGCMAQDYHYDSKCFSITLHIQLSCKEKSGNGNRLFSCESEGRLCFFKPVEVSAHMQMHSSWGGDSTGGVLACDGTPLTEGGTLLCTIKSRVNVGDTLTLKEVTLDTPSWMELRPDEAPAHSDLLPAKLGPLSTFSCIFDVLEKEQDRRQYQEQLSRMTQSFDTEAIQRRASRKFENNSGFEKSKTDMQDWKYGPPPDESSSSSEGLMEQLTFAASHGVPPTGDDQEGIMITPETAGRVARDPSEELDSVSGKPAEDVVDLSTPGEQSRGVSHDAESSSMLSHRYSFPVDELATLRLQVEISGVMGATTLDRKICMDAFRTAKKRFRIERGIEKVGKIGDVMQLKFQVRSFGGRRTYYDDTEDEAMLQFEVDANPEVWLVIGRRRGRITIQRDAITTESVNMIPLTSGWHHVPCLRLFATDGQALPFSRYENVNEYKEVVVLPCTAIVGGCAIDDEDASVDAKNANAKGNMPVVVASDSFFGS